MNKRGQFYLVAAIIIIGVIVGFSAVSNYSTKKDEIRLYNLKEELGIESAQVLDHGTYMEYNRNEMDSLLENFTILYSNYAGEDKNMYFVFGNTEGVTIINYEEIVTGTLSIDTGSGGVPSQISVTEDEYMIEKQTPEGNKVTIEVPGFESYDFKLKPGENFYFIITQEMGEERQVVTG